MKIVFMGTPDFAVPPLLRLQQEHEILCVYTQPPRPAGRGQQLRQSPVHDRALRLGLAVRTPASLRSEDAAEALRALGADVLVVVAYGLILPPACLNAARHGALNIHASLLPRWRGAAPIHRAILAGDGETGVGIMRMEAGLDTGPVLTEARTAIGATETTGDLHDRLSQIGADLIAEVLQGVPGPGRPQATAGVTYAAKIDKSEARIDWSRPAVEVDRQIRGLSPFPGAWTLAAGERVKLLRSVVVADGSGAIGAPGTVGDGLTVTCGRGAVQVTEAQREGRRPLSGTALLQGWTLPDRLE